MNLEQYEKVDKESSVPYVVIGNLPEEWQKPFSDWLCGQTVPVIESEGDSLCAYYSDFERWAIYFINGLEAKVID